MVANRRIYERSKQRERKKMKYYKDGDDDRGCE